MATKSICNNDTIVSEKVENRDWTVTYLEEKNDHDGYCTDDECVYSSRTYTRQITVPTSVTKTIPITYKSGSEHGAPAQPVNMDSNSLVAYADPPIMSNSDGSYYCSHNKKARARGLGKHEARVSVVSAIPL